MGAHAEIYAKRTAKIAKKKGSTMLLLKCLVINWRKVGQQAMQYYVIVHRCLATGYSISKMTHHIQLEIYPVKTIHVAVWPLTTHGIRKLGAPS